MARSQPKAKGGDEPFDAAPWQERENWTKLLLSNYAKVCDQETDLVDWVKRTAKLAGISQLELRKTMRRPVTHTKLLNLQRAARLRSKDPAVRAKARWRGIGEGETWMGCLLEEYRDRKDRIAAAMAVGKNWREVEEALAENPRFAEAFLELEHELTIQLEDAALRGALAGQSTAERKLALEARSSRFAKGKQGGNRVGHARSQAANTTGFAAPLVTWAGIFGSTNRDTAPLSEEPEHDDAADPRGTLPGSDEGAELAAAGSA